MSPRSLLALALFAAACKGNQEPAGPPATTGSAGSAVAVVKDAGVAIDAPSIGALGVKLHTAKTSSSASCRSFLCADSYVYVDGTKLTFTVEAEPGVTLKVPGATLKHGDTWTIDLLDRFARAKANSAIDSDALLATVRDELGFSVKTTVVRGGKQTDELMIIGLTPVENGLFEGVTKGQGFAFPQDATAVFPKDALVLLDEAPSGGAYVTAFLPSGVTVGEVDLVAKQRTVERNGTPCAYYDSKNQKVLKGRTASDRVVELYDRRTGKLVDKATFAGTFAPCPSTIMSNDYIRTPYDDTGRTEKWLASHVKLHPGELEAALPPLPPPGAAADQPAAAAPVAGQPVEKPSRLVPVAGTLGMTEVNGSNSGDVFETAYGSLGEEWVTIESFSVPTAPAGGSAAAAFKGTTFVAVVIENDPDPKAAQTALQRALAKAPKFSAMADAANAPPWYRGEPPVIAETDRTATSLLFDDKNESHKGMVYLAHIATPSEKTAKRVCRTEAKRAVCVEADPPVNVAALLARIK